MLSKRKALREARIMADMAENWRTGFTRGYGAASLSVALSDLRVRGRSFHPEPRQLLDWPRGARSASR
jgi:hypothetical protein